MANTAEHQGEPRDKVPEQDWITHYMPPTRILEVMKRELKEDLSSIAATVDGTDDIADLEAPARLVTAFMRGDLIPSPSELQQLGAESIPSQVESGPETSHAPWQLHYGKSVGIDLKEAAELPAFDSEKTLIPGIFAALHFQPEQTPDHQTTDPDLSHDGTFYLFNGEELRFSMWPHPEMSRNDYYEKFQQMVGIVDGVAITERLNKEGEGFGGLLELERPSEVDPQAPEAERAPASINGVTAYVAMLQDEHGNTRPEITADVPQATTSRIARLTLTRDHVVTVGVLPKAYGLEDGKPAGIELIVSQPPIPSQSLTGVVSAYLKVQIQRENGVNLTVPDNETAPNEDQASPVVDPRTFMSTVAADLGPNIRERTETRRTRRRRSGNGRGTDLSGVLKGIASFEVEVGSDEESAETNGLENNKV